MIDTDSAQDGTKCRTTKHKQCQPWRHRHRVRIGHIGQVMGATLLLVAAKVVGTALVARMFTLVEPQLMHLWWFAKYYPRWKRWKDLLIEKVRTSWTWRAARWMKKKLWRDVKNQYKKFSFWKTN